MKDCRWFYGENMINNIIKSKSIKIDGLDVQYYSAGQGEPLVVIHGGGGDAKTWWNNINVLASKYTVYAPDLPGYGGSQALAGNYYVPELAEFIDRFTVSLGLEKFHLMGHSLGGGIALNYTLNWPGKVKKLVLVSSLCLGREIGLWLRLLSFAGTIHYLGTFALDMLRGLKWVLKKLNPMEFVFPLTKASVIIGENITTFKQQKLVLKNRLPELHVPTLLVWGARDPVVPVKQAYAAAKEIPSCQVMVFKNRGHNVHRDELKLFSSILTTFLG
jgi:pimeloyl-ACP methyl ester carboxylesterase